LPAQTPGNLTHRQEQIAKNYDQSNHLLPGTDTETVPLPTFPHLPVRQTNWNISGGAPHFRRNRPEDSAIIRHSYNGGTYAVRLQPLAKSIDRATANLQFSARDAMDDAPTAHQSVPHLHLASALY